MKKKVTIVFATTELAGAFMVWMEQSGFDKFTECNIVRDAKLGESLNSIEIDMDENKLLVR